MPLTYPVAIASPLRQCFDYLPPGTDRTRALLPGMRVIVPFGKRREVGIIAGPPGESTLPVAKLRAIESVPDDQPVFDEGLLALCEWAAGYYHHPLGDVFQQALPVLLRTDGHTIDEQETLWKPTEKGQLIALDPLRRSPRQLAALQCLREHPGGLTVATLRHMEIEIQHLKALAEKGLAAVETRTSDNHHFHREPLLAEPALTANSDQAAALARIGAAEGYSTFLLAGVTGSGKTEVYLQAIERCLAAHRQALVLVPEIGLTPQTLARFRQRFNVPVLALHSGLNDSERLRAWRQSRAGACGIVIGTRSAIFTPMRSPGLIIIDEEHDTSFKQQEGFRYSARDLALVRAKRLDIPVILGSATPSLESLHNAESGRYVTLPLPRRAGLAQPPPMQVLDIKGQALQAGLSLPAIEEARRQITRGNQVMFFINRRGYAPSLLCHDCGWHSDCKRCDAHMTFHRDPPHLHCHHCDAQAGIPRFCPGCGSSDIRPMGQGTERIEDELRELFPGIDVVRMDRDTTQTARKLQQQLNLINEGKPCLLVGTQMLAKGHHFPQVTLVVVINVDGGLFSGNFRALEHTAQLIEQVAGRAGRSEKPGRVLLQTHHPQHPALTELVNQGYLALARQLLKERAMVELPPYGCLAVLRAEANHADQVRFFLLDARAAGQALGIEGVDLLGPIPAVMGKRSGRYRFTLVVKGTQRPALHRLLRLWLPLIEALPSQKRARWHIDVDPVNVDD